MKDIALDTQIDCARKHLLDLIKQGVVTTKTNHCFSCKLAEHIYMVNNNWSCDCKGNWNDSDHNHWPPIFHNCHGWQPAKA